MELIDPRIIEQTKLRRTARALIQLQKKDHLPKPVFDAILGTVPGTSLEVVPLNKLSDGTLKVFLKKRDLKDKFWPDQWHCPGTMVLNSDFTGEFDFKKPWERLKTIEFMEESLLDPIEVSRKHLKTKRGNEIALIYYVEVPDNLKDGRYFKINELPDNLVDHHRIIINEAVAMYNKHNEK